MVLFDSDDWIFAKRYVIPPVIGFAVVFTIIYILLIKMEASYSEAWAAMAGVISMFAIYKLMEKIYPEDVDE